MSISIAKSVNFGLIKTGLSTVGYTLKNSDGTTALARVSTGITELVAGTGIYGSLLNLDPNFTGFIIWDTGDVSPYYAIENFDGRNYAGPGYVGINSGFMPAPSWDRKEKKKLFDAINNLIKLVKKSDQGSLLKQLTENISKKEKDERVLTEAINVIKQELESISKKDLQETERLKESINNLSNQLSGQMDPLIEGLQVLMKAESMKILMEEIPNV